MALDAAIAAAPHWFTYPAIDPVAFNVWHFAVRWYGLTYLFGALLVYLQLASRRGRARTGLTIDQTQEFVVYGMLGVIVGARLFFLVADVLTPAEKGGHSISFYLHNPLQAIAIWQGGLAFHGGLIGALIAGVLFLRRARIPFYPVADETIVWMPLNIALTRVANFINGELPGRITDSPIGVHFPNIDGFRYPSTLFEGAGMLVIALPLLWLLHGLAQRRAGLIFWAFFAAYGAVRTVVEFFREPGIVFLGLTGAQYLTIAMLALGVVMMWRTQQPEKPQPKVSASGRVRM